MSLGFVNGAKIKGYLALSELIFKKAMLYRVLEYIVHTRVFLK